MITPDTNVLLYAHVSFYHEHTAAKNWLEDVLSEGTELIGLSWQVITSFIRIGTNPKIFQTPLTIAEVESHIEQLIGHPLVKILLPQSSHWNIFMGLIKAEQVTADLVMDAHLAALAIEHKARLATTDRDFARFRGLKYFNPLDGRV